MTYIYCNKVITNTIYTSQEKKDEMQLKLDVFLLNNRITQDKYTELTLLLVSKQIVV